MSLCQVWNLFNIFREFSKVLQQHHQLTQSKGRMPKKVDAKPRGRMTAYAFFVQTCREEHKKKHPEENVVFAEFSKKCAERWKVRGFWCMFYFKATTEKCFFLFMQPIGKTLTLKNANLNAFKAVLKDLIAELSHCHRKIWKTSSRNLPKGKFLTLISCVFFSSKTVVMAGFNSTENETFCATYFTLEPCKNFQPVKS